MPIAESLNELNNGFVTSRKHRAVRRSIMKTKLVARCVNTFIDVRSQCGGIWKANFFEGHAELIG